MNNQRVVLASRPAGWVSEADFKFVAAPAPRPGFIALLKGRNFGKRLVKLA
jgi:NADPH-dependent curcumin reductase CurA